MIATLLKKLLVRKPRSELTGTDSLLVAHFKHMPGNPIPLSAQELDELDRLLRSALPQQARLGNITALDGFLTCLTIGPHITPEEWLGTLFPEVSPLEQELTERLMNLIERRHQHLAADLTRTKPRFQPLFVGFTTAKTARPLGRHAGAIQTWCAGFMAGTDLRPRAWKKLLNINDAYSPLYMLWLLGTLEGHQKQWHDAVQCYRDEGYDAEQAEQMTLRWYGLPGMRRREVSDLKKSILQLQAHWRK